MGIEFIKDILLIVLCGAAAFYCWMLSHRLKRLNNLKSGVGASIVTLTQAIERTHDAAQTARGELFEAIDEMKGLIDQAEAKAGRLEAAMGNADAKIIEAEQANASLQGVIEKDIPAARRKALNTTEGLLKIISDLNRLNASLPQSGEAVSMPQKDAA